MIRHRPSIIFQLLLYLFIFTNISCETASAQVRNTTWESSVEEVKEVLGRPYPNEQKGTDRIVYLLSRETTAGVPTYIGYYFVDDQLARIAVIYINPSLTITQFETISNQITSKYGTPYTEQENWHDDSWEDNDNYLDHAISMGDVTITKAWKKEDTLVQFTVGRLSDGNAGQMIEYYFLELYDTYVNAVNSDF